MSATEPNTVIVRMSDGEAATHRLAGELALRSRAGDCFLLRGDLGAGKTTFARGFIRALCGEEGDIVSPTFTLAQTYDVPGGGMLWHFDLYRIKSPEDVWELGLEDALLTGISLIEWPEMAGKYLPEQAIDIHIAHGGSPQERLFTISGMAAYDA